MAFDRYALRDRILADLISAPFRDRLAFVGASTRAQWIDTDRYVRGRARAHAKDLRTSDVEIEACMAAAVRAWKRMTSPGPQGRILRALSAVATNLLHQVGSTMVLRLDTEDTAREILLWRFVSLLLPPSILIAAASRQDSTTADEVLLLVQSIAPDVPVAELHVHHAAAIRFEDLWEELRQEAICSPDLLWKRLQESRSRCPGLHPHPCPSSIDREKAVHAEHMTEWADLLVQAFITRRVLDEHSFHASALKDCVECKAGPWQRALRHFGAGHVRPSRRVPIDYPWKDERTKIELGRRDALDPRTRALSLQQHRTRVFQEHSALKRAFAYAQCDVSTVVDAEFETLFLQYLRVKTAAYRLIVQSPSNRGLEAFLQHFSQIKSYRARDSVWTERSSEPARTAYTEHGLKVAAIEYRVAPDAWIKKHAHEEIEGNDKCEHGWVIHFKRDKPDDGLPLFGGAVRRLDADGASISRIFADKPRVLRSLRGLDLAGIEEHQPLWVAAETLRKVRANADDITATNGRLKLRPLGLTVHAGEDFDWLTSGVRAVAEPIHWGLLRRGDRIGHGISLTLDPDEWWRRRKGKSVCRTRFDRLLDLAFLATYTEERTWRQNRWLANQLREVVEGIWGKGKLSIADGNLIEAVQQLWTRLGSKLPRILMSRHDEPPSIPDGWCHRYLWRPSVQKRAKASVRLKIGRSPEWALLKVARRTVIHQLARRQVCIETNPTSNLVVAGLDGMLAQAFLHQRATIATARGDETLTWTISTDDPLTFATSLADEYAYAWAGMVLREPKGHDPAYARALLDEAAATSMRMRFTVPIQRNNERADKRTYRR